MSEKRKSWMSERMNNLGKARKAIIEHCQDRCRCSGVLSCPVCEKGNLHYSRASNGHVHARCETPGCVCWME